MDKQGKSIGPGEAFMRHFRWLTPLLLSIVTWMMAQMYEDFKAMRQDVNQLKINYASMRVFITHKLDDGS